MGRQSIVKTRAILFLGAGGTAPLGKKLMREFVKYLDYVEPIRSNPLFQNITAKECDLEFLLEELQDLETKEYIREELASSASNLRQRIEREIFRHYRSFPDLQKVKEHFLPLFQGFYNYLRIDEPLVVFTTNYDLGVEEFCRQSGDYKLFDGFTLQSPLLGQMVWSPTSFKSFKPTRGVKNVVLFKLHGSTDWFKSGDRIIRGPEVFAGDDEVHPNLIIYPAMRKVAVDDPFFTAYDFLQQCLSNARCLLVVGYSFRDQDSLTRLRSAVRANPQLKIGVYDPNAKALIARLKDSEIAAEPLDGLYQPLTIPVPQISPISPMFDPTFVKVRQFLKGALTPPSQK